ncbi:Myb/SANT-like transcription factor [Elysia marginata]|uniref:Myb/SANT-like transcription factor n=1 Tax=Elysia marginata TaxID=1093978 RepID=A0AAV4HBF5_9GAST|nr:Myb/SANT-like transcription factor [Elysia marginata]
MNRVRRRPGRSNKPFEESEMKHLIDTEYLIAIVEHYPVLWDRTNESYKCSYSTAQAWKEVCRALFDNYDSLDEYDKNRFVQTTMKRWKNIRDAWAKAQKRLVNDNQTVNGRLPKKYIFQEQLTFLKKVIKVNDSIQVEAADTDSEAGSDVGEPDSDVAGTEAGSDVGEPDSDVAGTSDQPPEAASTNGAMAEPSAAAPCSTADTSTKVVPVPTRKRKLPVDGFHDDDSVYYKSSRPPRDNQESRHLLFFRSLLPSLNDLNEEQILEFQVGVLKLMQMVRKTSCEAGDQNASARIYNWKIEECSP